MLDIQRKETILAIETAAGAGAIATIRLSGTMGISMAAAALSSEGKSNKSLTEMKAKRLQNGK